MARYIVTYSLLIFCISILASLAYYTFAYQDDKLLRVTFFDVGQGDSAFIETPNGVQVLIDGGADKNVVRELSSVMSFFDRTIDVVIATHPDNDHIGGLPDVFTRFEVGTFIEPGVFSDNGTYETLIGRIEDEGSSHIIVTEPMELVLDHGVIMQVLFPDRDLRKASVNTASIVSLLSYGDHEFLFTGDIPKSIETFLADVYGAQLKSDVLKVSHHGSDTSSAEVFIDAVAPMFAVISSGRDNRYGHPHQDVVDRFVDRNISLLLTSEEGTVSFESDGEVLIKK